MILLCTILDFFFTFVGGSVNPFYLVGGIIGLLSLKYKGWRLPYLLFCGLQAALLTIGVVTKWYLYGAGDAAAVAALICFKLIASYKAYEKEV